MKYVNIPTIFNMLLLLNITVTLSHVILGAEFEVVNREELSVVFGKLPMNEMVLWREWIGGVGEEQESPRKTQSYQVDTGKIMFYSITLGVIFDSRVKEPQRTEGCHI
ncbi:hypothetical protein V9T40_008493 [Parthenolecanium corni]|uniref:Uncharacterized protein n=1 Tax=Parthenolecanium corni TaxID=536013 RepID=A0AAN9Y7X8_9HEMI